ncbi:sporulation integral membrane protein YtvI [Paenibacillus azoreducens]|uniref:Sporulation integral membrane protein YtvI n=1 Tax=Paenibacillus azoreducens TaxID=116718 RepID=A0A919Y8L3_9BACL|nr:sporulation integral membrane protein YtvI [Paenibacillus azoreducens]GIO45824.1 sporulation integral membrane protein YtvI [Paenibacillus azoreducens]
MGKQLLLIGIGLALLYVLFTAGAPFLLAALVAISLEPVHGMMMAKWNWNRVAAASLTCTLFLLLVLLLVYMLGLQVFGQLVEYWKNAPSYFAAANDFVQNTMTQARGWLDRIQPELAESLRVFLSNVTQYAESIVNSLSSAFLNFARGIPGTFVFFVVFFVAVYLFSFGLPAIRSGILTLFDDEMHEQIQQVLSSLKRSIFGFLQAQMILSAFTYVVTLTGLLILDIHYPLAIAMLVMFVDIMPILGVGSVLIPWAVYLFIVGDSYTGFGLMLLFIVITVARRVIEPKVIGDSVGIGALSALVSMYVGFKLVGVIGVFIGPLVVIIYSAVRKAGLFQIKIKF